MGGKLGGREGEENKKNKKKGRGREGESTSVRLEENLERKRDEERKGEDDKPEKRKMCAKEAAGVDVGGTRQLRKGKRE